MSHFIFNIISSHSIVIPAMLLLFRWRSIPAFYHPFTFLIWLGSINEFISLYMILHCHSNMVNSNIYVLLEYSLLLWQFQYWNSWQWHKTAFLFFTGTTVWIADNIILHSLTMNNSLFRMIYSAFIVLLSMMQISKIIMRGTRHLVKNAQLLLCMAFLIYYTFKTYFESYNLFDVGISDHFFYWLWLILNIVNLFVNVIYSYAILWIRKNIPFTLPY